VLGGLALLPVVGWAGRGIGLAADVARGLSAASDVAETVATGAQTLEGASEGGVASTEAANDAESEPLVDFAHGTTPEYVANIRSGGISREAGLQALFGSSEPGSFFTTRVDRYATWQEALSEAASWGARRYLGGPGPISLVIVRLPESVVRSLEAGGSLVDYFNNGNYFESKFAPESFDIVNSYRHLWDVIKVRD